MAPLLEVVPEEIEPSDSLRFDLAHSIKETAKIKVRVSFVIPGALTYTRIESTSGNLQCLMCLWKTAE